MIKIPRWFISLVSLAFASYQVTLGLLWLSQYESETPALIAILLYITATVPTLVLYRGQQLPLAQTIYNLFAITAVPLILNSQISTFLVGEYTTWYVTGIGILLSAMAVRDRRITAWVGTVILVTEVIAWGGIGTITKSGLIGAFLLIFAAQAIATGISRAEKDTAEFTARASREITEAAAITAARAEHTAAVSTALSGSMPMLQLIRDKEGDLSQAEKEEARLLELDLRDQIRGRAFIDERVREAVRSARLRFVEVSLLDEGGLDDLSEVDREKLLIQVANTIDQVSQGRVTVRAPQGEDYRISLLATRAGEARPDLWLKFGQAYELLNEVKGKTA